MTRWSFKYFNSDLFRAAILVVFELIQFHVHEQFYETDTVLLYSSIMFMNSSVELIMSCYAMQWYHVHEQFCEIDIKMLHNQIMNIGKFWWIDIVYVCVWISMKRTQFRVHETVLWLFWCRQHAFTVYCKMLWLSYCLFVNSLLIIRKIFPRYVRSLVVVSILITQVMIIILVAQSMIMMFITQVLVIKLVDISSLNISLC